jgi:hypothetical protein
MKFKEYIILLTEKRRNPEQNPKIGIVEALKPYKDNPDIYISFTTVDKIGINPQSPHDTPLGIYSYPLKEMWNDIVNDTIPFAGDAPYVWIIKSKNTNGFIKDLYKDYTSKSYDDDVIKIKKLFKNNQKILKEIKYLNDKNDLSEITYDKFIDEQILKYTKFANMRNAVSAFWNITRNLSAKYENGKTNSIKWNFLLRKLGYTGFADKSNKGIIHPSEPTQAVFLTKDAFTIIEKILNKRYREFQYWKNGTWQNGTWEDGTWEDGTWGYGIWKKGTWKKGTWKGGTWKGGTWKGGTWKGGTWEYGFWDDGTWENGIWKDGFWENGIWKNGTWVDGIWHDGTWEKGVWQDGIWRGDTWKNGTWKKGVWKNGIWQNGIWQNGTWQNGTWQDGIWENGTWNNGIWRGGTWQNGTWQNGTWEGGYDKLGNFHKNGDSPDKW